VQQTRYLKSTHYRLTDLLTARLTSGLTERSEELRQGSAERRHDPGEARDPNIPLTSFNAANIIPVQIGAGSQFLLRDAQLTSQFPHPAANEDRQIASHEAYRSGLNTIGLHTIVCVAQTHRPRECNCSL
jgi:hypothetical protein